MADNVDPIDQLPAVAPAGSDFLIAWRPGGDAVRLLLDDIWNQGHAGLTILSSQILDSTPPGRGLLTAASVATQQNLLGLGAYALLANADFVLVSQAGSPVVTNATHPPHQNRPSLDRIGTGGDDKPTWDGAPWPGTGGGGVTAHSALTGLGAPADDHPQYLTQARGDARYPLTTALDNYLLKSEAATTYARVDDSRFHTHTNKSTLDKISENAGLPLWNGGAWPGGGGGVTAHSALTGLGAPADDHPQYLTQARGDARYPVGNKATLEKITEGAGLPIWNGSAWPGVTAHSALSGLGADDHTQYLTQTRGDARYPTNKAAAERLGGTTSPTWNGNPWPYPISAAYDLLRVAFDGQGAALTVGIKAYISIERDCSPTGISLVSDVAGNATVTVTLYQPVAGVLTGADVQGSISLAAVRFNRDTTLTGWNPTFPAGWVLEFAITGTPATLTYLSCSIGVLMAP